MARVGTGRGANALLILFDRLYAAELKIASGASAGSAVLAAVADANRAIRAAANAQLPRSGGDAMLTINSQGKVVWDFNTAKSAYVKAGSRLGQELIHDALILEAFNALS